MSEADIAESNEKSFSELSFQQKRELLFLYEDKLGVIFRSTHLSEIFGDIRDETFTDFSYDREKRYVDSYDAAFLIDFLVVRIMGETFPSHGNKELFINRLHDKISKEGWTDCLYNAGGLEGISIKEYT